MVDNDEKIRELERENKQLREQLDRVNRERIEYLQNVSHQLVAPLNAMKWHIENLTNARVSLERGRKVLRSVYSQATMAVHLAKNFALMSNLEADHALSAFREPLQPIPLCQLLVNLVDDFQPQGWDKDIQIGVVNEPLDRAPAVLVIKPLISQVFSNIIENGIKYSKGSSKIVIDGTYNAQKVSVNIRNRGIPLRAEDAKRVFERGYRTKEAKNAYPAGTGLKIPKTLILPVRGLACILRKRLLSCTRAALLHPRMNSIGSCSRSLCQCEHWKGKRGRLSQKTVLLVDDEQLFLEALEDALQYEGYRVLKARDVSTALQILQRERVDVVTVDIMLSPGAKLEDTVNSQAAGVYLCERITREQPNVCAFCLSVVNDPETIRRIKRLGIPFLRKGETPLRTVLSLIRSRLTGIAYSTERDPRRNDDGL